MKFSHTNKKQRAVLTSALFFTFMLCCWGNTLYIFAKARLAQYLIADAWEQTLEDGQRHTPWPWADTWPVARLQDPQNSIDLYVLAGASGTSLAFGPGHLDGSALPGEQGTVVFGGHRDTHFAFLEKLETGDHLRIQLASGEWQQYEITDTRINNSETEQLSVASEGSELLLITCYPFRAVVPGGPLRYVVKLQPVSHEYFSNVF